MKRCEYIVERQKVERQKATKRLNAEIRAMPEFAAVVVETEAHCRAHSDWLAHAQVFNHAGEIDNGQK